MKYSDGTVARTGDRVRIVNGESGTIVFFVDTAEFSDEYPAGDWESLERGVTVRTDSGALVHFEEGTNGISLLAGARAT